MTLPPETAFARRTIIQGPASASARGCSRASRRRRRPPEAPRIRRSGAPNTGPARATCRSTSGASAPALPRPAAAAAGPVPRARLLELRALVLRPDGAGPRRIFADERHCALGLRRLDHGPRWLRPLRQLRQQFRRRQQRRGPESRDPAGLRETGQRKMHFYGTSSGAIRAGAYAQAHPEQVDRLVLVAFTHKGTGSPEIGQAGATGRAAARQQPAQARRRHDPVDLHP